MPPQPGIFYDSKAKQHRNIYPDYSDLDGDFAYHHNHAVVAGPSSRPHVIGDDARKEKKRKELAGKLGKEMNERRDDGRAFAETLNHLQYTTQQLATKPEDNALYNLRLLPLSLERSALLAQMDAEEQHSLDCVQAAYDEERERVEDEWKRGRDRVRERLLEGIEERRRRAREEKEGEGTVGDPTLDSQSRPHITRKLRNKMGTSPPPTPMGASGSALQNGSGLNSGVAITTGPFSNPHSLSVDELPSPFPLPLTSTTLPSGLGAGANGTGASGATTGRRRPKGGGAQSQAIGGLGKSLAMLAGCKEAEADSDLGEIRRGNKRRRVTAMTAGKNAV
ncbi:hypothetical protein EYR40_008743 [Pleurotus pulmonarius]|nr:hypothetical protein EYR36_009565 [Pleurotus pulmonarius]KAF4593051.1 hypothetical protein EYR38_008761 [Pleurotus pulmonarius]KAF4593945.1 hypothetical protein EYR40_008743 [Pleurotus pulmonarius]